MQSELYEWWTERLLLEVLSRLQTKKSNSTDVEQLQFPITHVRIIEDE